MSGFLHQLAGRSLGLTPRVRNAAASPQLPAPNLAARDDALPDTAATHPSGMAPAAPSSDLAALDQWARMQARLVPPRQSAGAPEQPRTHTLGAFAAAAVGDRASLNASTEVHPAPARAAVAAPAPLVALLGHDPQRTSAQESNAAALEAHPGARPTLISVDAAAADSPRGQHAARDVHVEAQPPSAQRSPARDPPLARATADRQPAPDVHITIDRLEVAPPAPIPRAAPPARSAALSLRAYLAARRWGQP